MQDIMAQMQASMKVISEQQADIVQLRQSLIQQQALQVPTTLQSQTSAPNQSVSTTAQTQQGQPNTGATNPIQHQTQTLPPNTNTALLTPAIGQTTYITPPIPPPLTTTANTAFQPQQPFLTPQHQQFATPALQHQQQQPFQQQAFNPQSNVTTPTDALFAQFLQTPQVPPVTQGQQPTTHATQSTSTPSGTSNVTSTFLPYSNLNFECHHHDHYLEPAL